MSYRTNYSIIGQDRRFSNLQNSIPDDLTVRSAQELLRMIRDEWKEAGYKVVGSVRSGYFEVQTEDGGRVTDFQMVPTELVR